MEKWRSGIKENNPKLVFPEGVLGDKKKRNYLTKKRNSVFDLLDRISATYEIEKDCLLEKQSPCAGLLTYIELF